MCNNLTMGYFECDGSKNPLWECCQQFGLCQTHGRGIGAPPLRCRKAALLHYPFSQSLNTNFQVLEPYQKLANGATSARLLGSLKLRPITHTHTHMLAYPDRHSHAWSAHIRQDKLRFGRLHLMRCYTLPLPPFNVPALRRQRNKAKKRKIHILF